MYNIAQKTHPKYGDVVEITRSDLGMFSTPGLACNAAITNRRLWLESGSKKVRILVDDQVLTTAQAQKWADTEHKSLPKCHGCNAILDGLVLTHQLSIDGLFCSASCADKDYKEQVDKLNDEEECDYL